ncbi:MAG: DNA gyrase subunit A [Candidatus Shikimatogenerans bostrichidophilus]|nr:MAG: DNA gyrase subunit A [Candidatus Shikimatogenerans bostrichidophilus]
MKKYNILNIDINDEIKSSYIDYAMSVIISRALPDVRDGLKPVHRRILYAMYKLNIFYNKNYKKSARIVGEVLGKYHPHGDKSVYDSIVRMSQSWNLRYKLIRGQGNFGSIDNDPPAAMRYTEIKLEKITENMLDDINKNTVDMKYNFDDTLKEPIILPTKIPNLLINGIYGIAVGMATNMAPHNLKDTIKTICKYIDNPNISINKLIKYIKAPDFPTGGIILNYKGVKKAFKKGKGKIIIRSKFYIKEKKNKKYIIIKEIPYQVIKSNLIKKIFLLIKNEKINEIINIKDESNKKGIRIILILKKDSIYEKVINKLLKYSDLQINYHINNIALVNGKPKRLNLKKLIIYFLNHRNDVIIRKAKYFLSYYKKKIHLLKGFLKISYNIEKFLNLIKKSSSYLNLFKIIENNYKLSKKQIKFILNIKLYKLTDKEIKNILKKYKFYKKKIINNKKIISYKEERMKIIKKELFLIKKMYGDKRKTLINFSNNEFLEYKNKKEKKKKKFLLIISNNGYIKKTLLNEYKTQNRGGKGKKTIIVNKKDFIKQIIVAYNNYYIILFTKKGKCYWLKVEDIPQGNKKFKGRAIQNLIKIKKNDKFKTYILIKNFKNKDYLNNNYVVMVTTKGIIKKTILKEFSKPRKNGIKSIKIKKNDSLLEAKLTNGNNQILIAIKSGKIIRFNEKRIKLTNRNSIGVKGITIKKKNDKVIGIVIIKKNYSKYILVVSENGYGKISKLNSYRLTNRGGIGIKTINITKKTGKLISIISVFKKNEDLIIIKKTGIIIRIPMLYIRITGRNSQGVKLIKLNKNDKIADVIKVKNILNNDKNNKIIGK